MSEYKVRPILFAIFFGYAPFCIFGCAKVDDTKTPISKLHEYIFLNRTTVTQGYCYIEYYTDDTFTQKVEMDEDLLIHCEGVRAERQQTGWYAYFPSVSGQEIEITVQRPSEGSARIIKMVVP